MSIAPDDPRLWVGPGPNPDARHKASELCDCRPYVTPFHCAAITRRADLSVFAAIDKLRALLYEAQGACDDVTVQQDLDAYFDRWPMRDWEIAAADA